jgi:hypothetical protein
MLIDQINALESPVARMLLGDLLAAMQEAIFIPNKFLPEPLHGSERVFENGRVCGRSAASLIEIVKEQDDHEADQIRFLEEKESRLREYEENQAMGAAIAFREYENLIYKNCKNLLQDMLDA